FFRGQVPQAGAPVDETTRVLLLLLFLAAWLLPVLGVLVLGLAPLRARLLLGRRGVAVWSPWWSRVVLWEELGSTWQSIPFSQEENRPPSGAREPRSGARLATPTFSADPPQVVWRALDELARRASERRPEALRPEGSPGAIRPAERGITEESRDE